MEQAQPDSTNANGAAPMPQRRWRGALAFGLLLVASSALVWWLMRPAPLVDRSIAVLPFENRSAARADEYLAPGIQDELLTLLARVGELRVMSRSATVRYAGSTASARQIGRELGVSYLLEGSVQRSGEVVRVHVTLIDAASDRQLWGSMYERSVADVFAVESEVAQGVARALQARLTNEERERISRPPTGNPAAYDAYLRARAFAERTTRTEAEISAAIAAFEEAVRLDPEFASAWAQLSRRNANFFSLGYDRAEARRQTALAALENAERLGPDLIDTKIARAYFQFVVEGDLEDAERLTRELESRNPASADVATGLSQITRELGQIDRSADYARRTLALDAMNPYRHYLLCQDYLTSRELALATQTCARALELLPGDVGTLGLEATLYQTRGELGQSRERLRALAPVPGDWRTLRAMNRQFLLDRDSRAAVALLEKYLADPDGLRSRRGVARRWLADAQRLAGNAGAARDTYVSARSELEAELARQPENPLFVGELAIVRARLGERASALELAQRCDDLARKTRRSGYIADCGLARIQVALATNASAAELKSLLVAALSQQGALPPLTPNLLRLDPEFDGQPASVRNQGPE